METIPYHPVIQVTPECVKRTRQFHGINDVNMIKQSLSTIREWAEKQPHLSEGMRSLSDNVLERIFILARGSVEGTKIKIDKLFTTRGMIPELALNKSMKEFEKLSEYVYYLPLPKINPKNFSRVMVTQFLTDKLDEFDLLAYYRYNFLVGEYRLNYDYVVSEAFIIDLKNINFRLLGKLNPIVTKKAEVLCTEGFGTKICGIHILNAPSFIDKLIAILKQALKEKVAQRIHVHNSYEDLHKYIPKEILPKDYDGEEQSCAKLAERWKEVLKTEEATKLIADCEKMVTDESRRDKSVFNQEYLGMPGSFRTLSVD